MSSLVPLSEAGDAGSFGGKAAGLARALRAGLPVPPGYALAPDLVAAIAEESPAAVETLRALAAKLPTAVAVRSSALGEDGASASFAGQHKTLLNVSVASSTGLAAAVSEVWRSARSASARAYRARMGLAETPIRMGIVIQVMLDPEVAGVLFTRNPTTGADERVVEAALGLGESVVMGLVTPDLFRIARGGHLLESRRGMQDVQVRLAESGGTMEREVPPDLATQSCLGPPRLQALEELAAGCERVFAGALDLEWAFAQDRLFLLQCRAITR